MASVAVTSISTIQYEQSTLDLSGYLVENYRIAAGQAPGDTAVIPNTNAPTRGRGLIRSVYGPVGNNLPVTGASTVTVTLPAMGATDATIPAVDVWVVWNRQ